MLPDLVDETLVEYEITVAYALGELAERERIAAAAAELDEATRAAGVIAQRDRVRERLELFARRADEGSSTWRGRYPGGVVDWETGRLARRIGAAA